MARRRRVPFVAVSKRDRGRNKCLLDAWSLVHVGWGAAAGAGRLNPWAFLALTCLYELIERKVQSPHGSEIWGCKAPESTANAVMDVGLAGVAYGVARHLRDR
jgi:hypothetical protein